jgi:hypothetical protein
MDIIRSNILSVGKLYIVIVCDKNIQQKIKDIIINILNTDYCYNIEFNYENLYEYYGIKK